RLLTSRTCHRTTPPGLRLDKRETAERRNDSARLIAPCSAAESSRRIDASLRRLGSSGRGGAVVIESRREQAAPQRTRQKGRRARTGWRRPWAAAAPELHHAGRPAAPQGRTAIPAEQGTPGRDAGRGLGGEQRRSQRERRLSVQQAASATDRAGDSVADATHRGGGSGRSGSPEGGPGGTEGVFRRDGPLRERRRS